MPHPNCLIVYVSAHGHTERIAERVAAAMHADGVPAQLYEVGDEDDIVLSAYGAIVIGAPVHGDRHPVEMVEWLTHHRSELDPLPTALFSVSLVAAEDTDEARAAAQGYVDELLRETDLRPRVVASFAGRLEHHRYHLPTRVLMRLVSPHHDEPAADVDYTDWAAVERFAHEAAALVPADAPSQTA